MLQLYILLLPASTFAVASYPTPHLQTSLHPTLPPYIPPYHPTSHTTILHPTLLPYTPPYYPTPYTTSTCPQKCPFEAVSIINLPSNLERDTTHRYSANSFKLHRLPIPRPGQVLGLVGTNGIGKSTALKILAGKQKPNLGRFTVPTLYIYIYLKHTHK